MLYVAVQPSDMYSTCKYSNCRLNVLLKLFLLNKKKLKLYFRKLDFLFKEFDNMKK